MTDTSILAHGVGSRGDLPVPAGPAAVAAAATLVISFVVIGLLWRSPRRTGTGRPLGPAAAILDRPVVRALLQSVALVMTGTVVVAGFAGPTDVSANVAPWAFYVLFWVGLVPASLLFGPVVRVLNPLRLLHTGLSRALRIDPDSGLRRLPTAVGYWPAAGSLFAFAWLELVHPDRSAPAVVATFVSGYAAVHLAAAVVFGRGWFARGDGFEVYSSLLASIAPLGRLPGGGIGWRNPLDGNGRFPTGPGLVAVVVVLVGTTAYDGLSRSTWWLTAVPDDVLSSTSGLLAATFVVGIVYLLGCWALIPATSRTGDRPGAAAFASTLAPIAAGYAIAHYFTLLVFDGQRALQLSVGLVVPTTVAVDYRVVGTIAIMAVQLGAIVAGHLIATLAAHDRAVGLYPARTALRTQYPMLGAMVALTMGAVGLLFAA